MVRHLKLAAVIAFVLLTAGELTLHHHSLIPEGGKSALPCVLCAFSADRTIAPQTLARPFLVSWLPDFAHVTRAPFVAPALLPSRAPPAVA